MRFSIREPENEKLAPIMIDGQIPFRELVLIRKLIYDHLFDASYSELKYYIESIDFSQPYKQIIENVMIRDFSFPDSESLNAKAVLDYVDERVER